jgi:hypothetical protein
MGKNPAAEANSSDIANELLDAVTKEFLPKIEHGSFYGKKLEDAAAGKKIVAQSRDIQAAIVDTALERLHELEKKITRHRSTLKGNEAYNPHLKPGWSAIWYPRWVLLETLRMLLRRALPLSETTVTHLFQWPLNASNGMSSYIYPLPGMAAAAENFAKSNTISSALAAILEKSIQQLRKAADQDKDCRKIADRLQALIVGGPQIEIQPGEAWSDAALADLKATKTKLASDWNALLLHCQTGGKAKFTELAEGCAAAA